MTISLNKQQQQTLGRRKESDFQSYHIIKFKMSTVQQLQKNYTAYKETENMAHSQEKKLTETIPKEADIGFTRQRL